MNTTELTQILREKYSDGSWAFIEQVPNATGFNKTRTADAMAMQLWPSKGLSFHGFEVKVGRGDWLTEIQDPSKAQAFADYCDYWWIVADKGVVKSLDELPATWGLMEPTKAGNLRVKKAATKLNPKTIDRKFLAGVMRVMAAQSPNEIALKKVRSEGFDEGHEAGRKSQEYWTNRANDTLDNLRTQVKAFEDKSGLQIQRWNAGKIGETVKALQQCNLAEILPKLENVRRTTDAIVKGIDTLTEQLKES